MNKKFMVFTVILAIAGLTAATTLIAGPGCCMKKASDAAGDGVKKATEAPGCGMKKAVDAPGCGMQKGAEIAPETICPMCGQIKGTEQCCKAGAVKCPKCNMDQGSPGCCRITPEK